MKECVYRYIGACAPESCPICSRYMDINTKSAELIMEQFIKDLKEATKSIAKEYKLKFENFEI